VGLITDQHFFRFCVILFGPQNDDPHLMIHIRNTDAFGKIPLFRIADADFFAVVGRNLSGRFIGTHFTSHEQNFAVEFQVADIRPLEMMNMIQIGRVGKVAVKNDIAGDFLVDGPVHQPTDELIMIDKFNTLFVALLLFDELVKIQWIMLAGRTDVVGNDIVMGNLVSLFSMIPEAAGVLNVFAVVINQGIVDGNNALRAVTGIRAFLEPGQTFQVKGLFIPVAAGYPAVQAGLVRGDGKFPVDGRDVFLVGDHQAGQVLGEMAAFGFIGEQIPQAAEGFLDDDWKFNDSWHRNILHDIIGHVTINICRQKAHSDSNVSILQKFSNNARLRDERLNMELFTGLPDARVSIETYRQYFFEERFHGALGYVPPREFKEQWLTAHPDFCMGALPPAPRDLTLDASKQRGNEKGRTARESGPASAPMTGRRSGCVPAEPYPLTGNLIGEEIRT